MKQFGPPRLSLDLASYVIESSSDQLAPAELGLDELWCLSTSSFERATFTLQEARAKLALLRAENPHLDYAILRVHLALPPGDPNRILERLAR